MTTPELAAALHQDDVTFWSERFKDHAMLLFILIDFQKADDLKMRAQREFKNWDSYLKNQNHNLLNQLIPALSNLKYDVLDRARMEQINLVLSPNDFISLVEHMIKELQFFLQITAKEISPLEELDFWRQENAEHTELASHLIPLLPLNPELVQKLQSESSQMVQRLNNIRNPDELLFPYQMSNKMAMDLDQLIKQGNKNAIQNLLHIMVEHEIKEGIRGAQRIREILMQNGI